MQESKQEVTKIVSLVKNGSKYSKCMQSFLELCLLSTSHNYSR